MPFGFGGVPTTIGGTSTFAIPNVSVGTAPGFGGGFGGFGFPGII